MKWKPACSSSQKRGPVSALCAQKLARLQAIVAERATWADQLAQIKHMHQWVMEVEHLLDESRLSPGKW